MKKSEIVKIKCAIKSYTTEVTKTSELAKMALANSGIYHLDGTLTPEYGGQR